MQCEQYQAVRDASMKLSGDDRMFLADLLYLSVERESPEEIVKMFEAEINQRFENLENGKAIPIEGVPIIQALKEGRVP